jgi:phosphate transport system protein
MAPSALRETFERQLQSLQDEILMLGSMAEQAVLAAVEALRQRDMEASHRIYEGDVKLNEKRYAIENHILTLIATQQPMARDLRFLAALFEINTELERIGDYAKGISKINLLLGEEPLIMPVNDLQTMAELGLDMLRRALEAFVARDAETARLIPKEDDQVDALYNRLLRELTNVVIQNPKNIDAANYLVWAAHNLERLADRVTNICERIVFVVTGEMQEFDVTDDEMSGGVKPAG